MHLETFYGIFDHFVRAVCYRVLFCFFSFCIFVYEFFFNVTVKHIFKGTVIDKRKMLYNHFLENYCYICGQLQTVLMVVTR